MHPGYRDSGFSDTDDEDAGVYVNVPTLDSPESTATNQIEVTEPVIYTQVQTTVNSRPPLPPKTAHKNNNIKDAFLDYDDEVKCLPAAPPVPLKQTKL